MSQTTGPESGGSWIRDPATGILVRNTNQPINSPVPAVPVSDDNDFLPNTRDIAGIQED